MVVFLPTKAATSLRKACALAAAEIETRTGPRAATSVFAFLTHLTFMRACRNLHMPM